LKFSHLILPFSWSERPISGKLQLS
jgi:hypothetical protein